MVFRAIETPGFFPCAPDPKPMGREEQSQAEEESWYIENKVEIESSVVIATENVRFIPASDKSCRRWRKLENGEP